MGDLPPLSDLVDEPADLRSLPSLLKNEARERREAGEDVRVDDLLAISRKNDMAYPTNAVVEMAEWFADLYDAEGRPETHPRDLGGAMSGLAYDLHCRANPGGAELRPPVDGHQYAVTCDRHTYGITSG